MSAPDNFSDAIEQNAYGPKRVRVKDQEVEQHNLREQIDADNHQAAKQAAAANKPGFGLRFQQITPKYF